MAPKLSYMEIMQALPRLKVEELATIKAGIEHLLKGNASDTRDATEPLYDVVARAIGAKQSFQSFKGMRAFLTWKSKAPGVVLFIDELYPQAKLVAKQALMSMLVDGLITALKRHKVPITIGTMATNIARLPQVFETAFPDYRESGMQHMILKAMERGQNE